MTLVIASSSVSSVTLPLVDEGDVATIEPLQAPRRLVGSEAAAVAERCGLGRSGGALTAFGTLLRIARTARALVNRGCACARPMPTGARLRELQAAQPDARGYRSTWRLRPGDDSRTPTRCVRIWCKSLPWPTLRQAFGMSGQTSSCRRWIRPSSPSPPCASACIFPLGPPRCPACRAPRSRSPQGTMVVNK